MSHPIRRPHALPQWPSYKGTAEYVGISPSFMVSVYVDPSLGVPGRQNATDLLVDADRVFGANNALFGVPGQPVSVIVFALGGQTDGTGGADHDACNFTTGGAIEVCASFGNSARVSALFEAELSECSMGGNLCGQNTGEPLSRWCAAVIGNNALADFATAPDWAQNAHHQRRPVWPQQGHGPRDATAQGLGEAAAGRKEAAPPQMIDSGR
jgi:hypothetical protein